MRKLFQNVQKFAIPLTFRCNFKCQYCYVSKDNRTEFDKKTLFKLFDTILRYNTFKDKIIHFYGGEPLLRFDLLEYTVDQVRKLEKKYKKHTDLGITTNGALLDKQKVEYLMKNFENFSVSIDSFDPDYKYRDVNKIIDKLPLLLKYKEDIHIKMTIAPECANSFFYYYQQLIKLGFKNINVQPVMGIYWNNDDIDNFLKNVRKIIKYKKFIEKKGYNLNFRMIDDMSDVIVNRKKHCSMIREELAIDSLGDIYPCQFFIALPSPLRDKYIIGNIYSGKINNQLIKKSKNLKLCKDNIIGIKLKKCKICEIDRFCQKVCYGFNIKKNKFEEKMLVNGITVEKSLFMVINKYLIN